MRKSNKSAVVLPGLLETMHTRDMNHGRIDNQLVEVRDVRAIKGP